MLKALNLSINEELNSHFWVKNIILNSSKNKDQELISKVPQIKALAKVIPQECHVNPVQLVFNSIVADYCIST